MALYDYFQGVPWGTQPNVTITPQSSDAETLGLWKESPFTSPQPFPEWQSPLMSDMMKQFTPLSFDTGEPSAEWQPPGDGDWFGTEDTITGPTGREYTRQELYDWLGEHIQGLPGISPGINQLAEELLAGDWPPDEEDDREYPWDPDWEWPWEPEPPAEGPPGGGDDYWENLPEWLRMPLYQAFEQQYPGYQGIDYQAFGQQYPTYGGYTSPLLQRGQQTIMDLLGGKGVGIPLEAEQYQTAMGRITEAERQAQEELTRTAARGGRLESGLYGGQQLGITEKGLEARRQTAQDFAIQSALMQQQAQQFAIPQALQYGQFGAGQEQLMYQSQANAWQAYNTEYTKTYEAARQRGLDEYGAEKEAYDAALNEYQTTYQSEVMRIEQYTQWKQFMKQLQQQLDIAQMGVQPPEWSSTWPYVLAQFLGGLGGGLTAGLT